MKRGSREDVEVAVVGVGWGEAVNQNLTFWMWMGVVHSQCDNNRQC